MIRTCQICHETSDQTQVVIYNKERNSKTGYLVMDDKVIFDSGKILKFLYYCETRGVHSGNSAVLDICENCLRSVRVDVN